MATANPRSVEVLRVWAAPDGPQDLTLRTNWNDPAVWGLLLVDIAQHVSRAYAANGHDQKRVLARIKAGFDAEWSNPTDVQPAKKGR